MTKKHKKHTIVVAVLLITGEIKHYDPSSVATILMKLYTHHFQSVLEPENGGREKQETN